MPADYYRLELRISRKTRQHLEKLRAEFKLRHGRSISMSELVSDIIESHLKRLPIEEEAIDR